MAKYSFGTERFLEVTRARWENRRIEYDYLLEQLEAGRSLQDLVGLIAGVDMARNLIRETIGAGRQSEKLLGDLLRRREPDDDPTVHETLSLLHLELQACNRIIKLLRRRIRAGEIFSPDEDVPGRRRRVMQKRWRAWLKDTD